MLVDPPPNAVSGLADAALWRSGCGRTPVSGSTVALKAAPDGATESGTTVTLTAANPDGGFSGYAVGDHITVAGVGTGYNGTNLIVTSRTPTTLTYTAAASGLAADGGGTVADTTNTNAGALEYVGDPWGSWGYQPDVLAHVTWGPHSRTGSASTSTTCTAPTRASLSAAIRTAREGDPGRR